MVSKDRNLHTGLQNLICLKVKLNVVKYTRKLARMWSKWNSHTLPLGVNDAQPLRNTGSYL